MTRFILATVIFLTLSVDAVCAYQFENFEFGNQKSDVENYLKNHGKQYIIGVKNNFIGYKDQILKEECTVLLTFTPKTNLLAEIGIVFEENGVRLGDALLELITKKHGPPFSKNDPNRVYVWGDISDSEVIILKYDVISVDIQYRGGKFFKQYELEQKEINELDIGRF